MYDFIFYCNLGLQHVLDLNAYDHLLFLTALAIPFRFREWKKVFILVSIFTIAHCTSLALAGIGFLQANVEIVEFLIPITIIFTALFNLYWINGTRRESRSHFLEFSTLIFGLIHGLGFSNYFKMIVSGENTILRPLIAFASGIELAQLIIILIVLGLSSAIGSLFGVNYYHRTSGVLILVVIMSIPLMYQTWPF